MEAVQKTVVTAFIFNEGKVLIMKRSEEEKFLPGYFELPGGKMNFGEKPEEALNRELQEETGLTVSIKKPFRVFDYLSNNGERQTVEIVYFCILKNGSIVLSSAHTEFKWINFDELDNFKISDETKVSIREGFSLTK